MTENLPAHLQELQSIAERVNQNYTPDPVSGGDFLKFSGKTGHWEIDSEEVDGEEVIIFTPSLQHGWMNWADAPPLKAMSKFSEPKPDKPPPMEGEDFNGKECMLQSESARALMLKFVDEELGQATFETSSMGGVENTDELYMAIIKQLGADIEYCYPKVKLGEEHYKGKRGTIYKPVWEIVAWCDQEGNEKGAKKTTKRVAKKDVVKESEPEAHPDDEPAAEEKPARRQRRNRNNK